MPGRCWARSAAGPPETVGSRSAACSSGGLARRTACCPRRRSSSRLLRVPLPAWAPVSVAAHSAATAMRAQRARFLPLPPPSLGTGGSRPPPVPAQGRSPEVVQRGRCRADGRSSRPPGPAGADRRDGRGRPVGCRASGPPGRGSVLRCGGCIRRWARLPWPWSAFQGAAGVQTVPEVVGRRSEADSRLFDRPAATAAVSVDDGLPRDKPPTRPSAAAGARTGPTAHRPPRPCCGPRAPARPR